MSNLILKGNTSGQVTIAAPDVGNNNTLTLPSTSSTLATQNSLGVRNLIINGDMNIAQRGTSVSGITTDGYSTHDRWHRFTRTAGTWTQTQSTDVPAGQGFSNSIKLDCTTANGSLSGNSRVAINQRIEGQNLQHLKYGTSNAETITLSFWVKSNKTGTYILELYNPNTAGESQVSNSYTISAADTWEKKIITVAGDTVGAFNNDNGLSLYVWFWLAAGSDYTSGTLNTSWATTVTANRAVGQVNLADSTSNYINITGVQLEVGTEATLFEHRPYDMELQRCQRYYEIIYKAGNGSLFRWYGLSGAELCACYSFSTEKRANPSITGTAVNASNCTNTRFGDLSPTGFRILTNVGGTNGMMAFYFSTNVVASSEL